MANRPCIAFGYGADLMTGLFIIGSLFCEVHQ